MMRTDVLLRWSLFSLAGLALAGCELQTEVTNPPSPKQAAHVVINEVFTLARPNPNTYSWIELYNPTSQAVSVQGWTLAFTTTRQVLIADTLNNFQGFPPEQGTFEIPLGTTRIQIPPDGFATFVNNENRLLTYTQYGPGTGPEIDVGNAIVLPPDTVGVDSIKLVFYDFYFRPTDQLVLKDSTGKVVDVVRYGNYVYPGPGPDPYPNNHTAGMIPDYQSLARYAGAYFTGNTADDFYITGVQIPQTRPIPQYYSQARHP